MNNHSEASNRCLRNLPLRLDDHILCRCCKRYNRDDDHWDEHGTHNKETDCLNRHMFNMAEELEGIEKK
jgi:hypothetical protein